MGKTVGICYAPYYTYLDHIVPLSQILDIPLLCADVTVEQTIKFYYPSMELIYEPDVHGRWKSILDQYDQLVYCDFYRRHHGAFQFIDYVYPRKMDSIYCPHGNSDKGERTFWMERFAEEDTTILYGPKMMDFLKSKNVWDRVKKPFLIGNFRKAFYLAHQLFFEKQLLSSEFNFGHQESRCNILYAPTWQKKHTMTQHRLDSSSFFLAYPHLFKNIPENIHLYVKMHPNFDLYFNEEIAAIELQYSSHPQIHFIKNFPPIYPLLSKMDAYIGDMSSIGHDFVTFNRPLFFLNHENRQIEKTQGISFFNCCKEICPEQCAHIYQIINFHLQEDQQPWSIKRKQFADYCYGDDKELSEIKALCHTLIY